MRLRPITFQGHGVLDEPFSECYSSIFTPKDNTMAITDKRCEWMVQFLQALELDFEGPPQWASTSHYDVMFYMRDYLEYSETPLDQSTVSLTVSLRQTDHDALQFLLTPGFWSGMSPQELCFYADEPAKAASIAAAIINGAQPLPG